MYNNDIVYLIKYQIHQSMPQETTMAQINVPAYEILRDRLREEIISGEIKGGSRITIQQVATRFNVSHQPVREAFQWLQGEGLIDILPHKGAVTRVLNSKLIINIYDIRTVIEGLLARLSAENFEAQNIGSLEQIHLKLQDAIHKDQYLEIVSLDHEFHAALYRLADNPEALEIYERYVGLLISLRRVYGFGTKRPLKLIDEHKKIIDAISGNKPDLAEKLVKKHAQGAKADLIACMKKHENS